MSHKNDARLIWVTVNSEIFAKILFSRIALKDIFATFKIRDQVMIYLYQSTTECFAISRGFYFRETSHMQSFAKIKPRENFRYLNA